MSLPDKASWLPFAILPAVIFLHFMFFKVWGYPLTIAPFALLCFILINFRVTLKETWLWASFLLILPFGGLAWSLSRGANPDVLQYFRTYALWSFASLVVLAAFISPVKKIFFKVWSLEKISFLCLSILCAFSLMQVVLFAGWGSVILYNPFGDHQYLGKYDVSRFAASYIVRAAGLYLEPSFNAFIAITLYVVCLLGKFRLRSSSALTLLSLFAIQSMIGLLAFVALWMFIVMRALIGKDEAFKKVWIRLGLVNLMLALVVAYTGGVSGVINIVSGVSGVSWLSRIEELGKPSTSGYYRIVAPLGMLKDVLVNDPLGKPFGQIEQTLGYYHLLNGTQFGKTLDNGMYLLVFYFGWVGIAFLAFLLIRTVMLINSQGDMNELILLVFTLLSFQFSGGILLPEYVLMLVMVIYQFRIFSSSVQHNGGVQRANCSTEIRNA